jgi:hypothetical protein
MKRGILFALLAAGVIAACKVASLNHPVRTSASNDAVSSFGYYYREDGALIYIDSNAKQEGYFVIKTKLTREQMFPDRYGKGTTLLSEDYSVAAINGINEKAADDAETYIRRGSLDEAAVGLNFIPILDKRTIQKLLDTIKDSRMNADTATDFREYGGFIRKDLSFTFNVGGRANPCSPVNPVVDPGRGGFTDYYHSHPSGEKDTVYSDGVKRTCSFVQAVSRRDQDEMRYGRLGYVFAMRDNFHRIYIYDSTGILATLPFEYLKSEYNNK